MLHQSQIFCNDSTFFYVKLGNTSHDVFNSGYTLIRVH